MQTPIDAVQIRHSELNREARRWRETHQRMWPTSRRRRLTRRRARRG